jgi:hypothetical protein
MATLDGAGLPREPAELQRRRTVAPEMLTRYARFINAC